MKEFDLTQVKVGDLDESDTILLKEYLKTLSKKKVEKFLTRLLDNEYSIGDIKPDITQQNDNVSEFIADDQFYKNRANMVKMYWSHKK
jgi:D-alanyl-D-alanine carboxypeptidase